jgi:hypothetical protein
VSDVRFTPKSGHSGAWVECPLSANSGHLVVAYSITLSANRRKDSGTVRPRLLSAFKFTTRLSPLAPSHPPTYGVEIRPLLVATIRRLPHRKIETILPTPGTVSPRVTRNVPLGPSNTAVPFITSRSVQPSMVVGLVSGTGANFTGA